MKFIPTPLDGLLLIETDIRRDNRGTFVKVFHEDTFLERGLNCTIKESHYSFSKKNVIRGMHYQEPPKDGTKVVYVTDGKILDVILDIRRGSPTYGKYYQVEISATNGKVVYVPSGFAHGYLSLENNSCVTYLHTAMYSPEHDRGIRVDSFNFPWGVKKPILSERDQLFPAFKDFKSPFQH